MTIQNTNAEMYHR